MDHFENWAAGAGQTVAVDRDDRQSQICPLQ